MYFEFDGINSLTQGLCRKILEDGVRRETRGFVCFEFPQPVVIKIKDPTARICTIKERNWNIMIPYSESLWQACGYNVLNDGPGNYVKSLYNYSDDGVTWRGCFTEDTRISLLTGENVPIKDLVNMDYFWVYSMDKTGKIVPGKGHSARITKKIKKLLKITLDSGEIIKCTEDHKFRLLNGSYKEAKFLTKTDSLSPLYKKISEESSYSYGKYEQILENREWIYTHKRIGEFLLGPKKRSLHHKDFNSLNNSPDNLEWVTDLEYRKKHDLQAQSVHMYKYNTNEEYRKESLKKSCKNLKLATKKQKEILSTEKGNYLLNHKIIKKEYLFLETEVDVYDITVDKYNNFALESGVFVHNSYGPRYRFFNGEKADYFIGRENKEEVEFEGDYVDQFEFIERSFNRDSNTRQAIINIGDPNKDCENLDGSLITTKDFPCSRTLHLMKNTKGKLDFVTHIRSNDIVFGLSAVNMTLFTFMHEYWSGILNIPLGNYYHIANNLHVYEDLESKVKEIAEAPDYKDKGYTYKKKFRSLSEFDDYIEHLDVYEEKVRKKDITPDEDIFDDPFFRDWAGIFYVKNHKKEFEFFNPLLNEYFENKLKG